VPFRCRPRYPVGVDHQAIIQTLRSGLPGCLAVYAFGSRVSGQHNDESDLDLAVLVEGFADPMTLFALAGDLTSLIGHEVDLLDLRAAGTVMQAQVLRTGERWWADAASVDAWEAAMLSEKAYLDERRAGHIEEILARGSIHG
jgi:uncharacterized protein